MCHFRLTCYVAFVLLIACTLRASQDSTGPNGINSFGLLDFNGVILTGTGISIGQVEVDRPGDPNFDTMNNLFHTAVEPAEVFFRHPGPLISFDPTMNEIFNNVEHIHAVAVAGVMISSHGTATGVSPDAELYAAGWNATDPMVTNLPLWYREAAITANHIATLAGPDIRAINMSFGIGAAPMTKFDGNRHLTQFIDWSASIHDILYVVAGNQGNMRPIPKDNFNGMTIGESSKVDNMYSQVSPFNTFDEDAEGERTSIDLLAPGDNVLLTVPGDTEIPDGGTSFAAPHVTGTVALLQEYAEERIMNAGAPRWNANGNARRHEVMKAVLMNSADKLIDDGTVIVGGNPVAPGNLLGMSRTVVKQDGTSTWLDSFAYDDTAFAGLGESEPLDVEMGTGHLNASRALTQFQSGEYDSDGADVPVIGWDYGTTTGEDDFNRYRFNSELREGSFISITLAWDRNVAFDLDADMDGEYDSGDTFEEYVDDGFSPPDDTVINDLNLHLMPKNAANLGQAIAQSVATVGTVEHIFFQIPQTGEYEFWVRQFDQEDFSASQDYAVAWWAAAVQSPTVQGDYDGNGSVGPEDYDLWKADFGSMTELAADGNSNGIIDAADYTVWRDNFGATLGSGTAVVPEPASIALFAVAGIILALRRSSQK